MSQPKCCLIGCDQDADYNIVVPHGRIEDVTQSCSRHVSDLLTDAPVHEIERLNENRLIEGEP